MQGKKVQGDRRRQRRMTMVDAADGQPFVDSQRSPLLIDYRESRERHHESRETDCIRY
jgi:hypothetical protein